MTWVERIQQVDMHYVNGKMNLIRIISMFKIGTIYGLTLLNVACAIPDMVALK